MHISFIENYDAYLVAKPVFSQTLSSNIGWELAVFIWVYSLIAFLIEDYLKVYFARILDHTGIKYFQKA
jgi:hypothetical protein